MIRVLADAMSVNVVSLDGYQYHRKVPVTRMTEFHVTLGARIASVRASSGHTRRNTGMAPHVVPSFGRVAQTGNGMSFVSRGAAQLAPATRAQQRSVAATTAVAVE